jgi:DNA-directed RNA polymerase specialized sigma24 family protein
MKTHNMFREEVAKETEMIRNYGGPKAPRLPNHADTYKAQALRELAKRLIYEQEIDEWERRFRSVFTLLDGVSPEDLAKVNGLPVEECRKRLASL